MSDKRAWGEGFAAGALSALAVVASCDGPRSTQWDEIAVACGVSSLIREAKKTDDSQLHHLLGLEYDLKVRRVAPPHTTEKP